MKLRRYLVMGEEIEGMAECPDWYALIQAAKYLKVAPWKLLKQSVYWQDRALIAMSVEAEARKILEERPTRGR
jgi:hypothetical protein